MCPTPVPLPVIPAWQLYGEDSPFPDLLHIERIVDRAAGLDWKIAPHRHLHLHQIFLIRSGSVLLTLDGRVVRDRPPLTVNIPRGHVHGFAFSAGTDGFVMTLPAGDFPELFGPQSEARVLLERAFVAEACGLDTAFRQVERLHAPGPLRRLRLRAAAVTLCCGVAEAGGSQDAGATVRDPRVDRFQDLIRAHLGDGWALSDYARALALSDRHLRRICLTATGVSAHGLLEAARLKEACRLLAYTRMRAQEVGYALGFEDPAYFARTFRRGMGMSVSTYRRRLETGEGQPQPALHLIEQPIEGT